MTLREYAEKRASLVSAAAGYLGANALMHVLMRIYTKYPKTPVIGALGDRATKVLKDVAIGSIRAGLNGKEFREIPHFLAGSANSHIAQVAEASHQIGKALRASGMKEEDFLKLPKKLRTAAVLSKVIVPSSAAVLGAGVGSLVPSASHKANELGLPAPPQKETRRKRNALIGAAIGAGAGFGGGVLGLHNFLGPFNVLKPIAEKVTGTKQTIDSAANVVHDLMTHKPGAVGGYLVKKLYRRPKS